MRRTLFTPRLAVPVAAAALLVFAACGHKKPPQPPPQVIPAPTQDLKVQQRGSELIFTFTYPQTTLAGAVLGELQAVQLWELERPVAPFGLPEEPTEEDGEESEAEDGAEPEEEAEEAQPEEKAAEAEPETTEEAESNERAEEASVRELERRERRERAEAAAASGIAPGDIAFEGEEDFGLEAITFETRSDEEVPLFGPRVFSDELSGEMEMQMLVDAAEFAATSRIRLILEGAELESAITGDRMVIRVPVAPPTSPEELDGYVFGIRTLGSTGLGSPYSNLVRLVVRPVPPPPREFAVTAGGEGIELAWSSALEEEDIRGFNVYRRAAQERSYGEPLRRLPASILETTDETARFGEQYIYAVATILVDLPLIETSLSTEREIDYSDRFAPPAPENLVALAEAGRVRVLWDAADADDVAGYTVERSVEGRAWKQLNDRLLKALEYVDTKVESGVTYRYRVSATDQLGNRGEPGEEAEARVP